MLDKIGEGGMGVVFLAHDAELERKIAIKLLRTSGGASEVGVRRLVREAQGLARLSHPHVIQVHEIGEHDGSVFVAMEYVEGRTLRDWLDLERRPWREIVEIVRQSGRGLEAAHLAGLVHRDFKPNNVIVGNDGRARVLDFGLARASGESSEAPGVDVVVDMHELADTLDDSGLRYATSLTRSGAIIGTPAYMAPEQMQGRACDPLSDQFSFCVTAFEALFGCRPYAGATFIELSDSVVGGRIAAIAGESLVPERIQRAVLRGLAADPRARWPTMSALLDELDAVVTMAEIHAYLERMRESGGSELFELDERARVGRFRIPDRLYGRDGQLDGLRAAFERTRGGPARPELVLVTGLAGVGKSSLVASLRPIVEDAAGLMITGKFDGRGATPLAAIRDLLGDLVASLERVEPSTHRGLAKRMFGAAGRNARLLLELVPALGRVLDERGPEAELGGRDRRFRLHTAVERFLAAFASPARPLVVFIDDLQWIDAASLELLEHLFASAELGSVTFVGACRTNEVDPAHRLRKALDRLKSAGASVSTIWLDSLAIADIEALLADTLETDAAAVAELARFARSRTGGNPFALHQLLHSLHEQGLFEFDAEAKVWRWQLDRVIERAGFDDIGEVLLGELEALPWACSRLVRIAACVGPRVDLLILAAVVGHDPLDVFSELWPTFEQGLLVIEGGLLDDFALVENSALAAGTVGVELGFRHERVREAAAGSLDEAERARIHLAIARALQRRLGPAEQAARAFEIADHFNVARSLLTDAERRALIELDIECGRRAVESAAFAAAIDYLDVVAELLPEDAATTRHSLWFAASLERARALSLDGRYAEARAGFAELLGRAQTVVERVLANTALVEHAMLEADYEAGYLSCCRSLALHGIELPERDEDARALFLAELDELDRTLAGRSPSSLIELPEIADDELPLLRLFHVLGALAYLTARPNVSGWLVTRMTNMSIASGNSSAASVAYALMACRLAERGDHDRAQAFGELAVRLCERYDDPGTTGRAYTAYFGMAAHYDHPLVELLPHFGRAFPKCLEAGDLISARNQLLFPQCFRLIAGVPLPEVLAEITEHLPFLRRSVPAMLESVYIPNIVLPTCTLMDVPLERLGVRFDEAEHLATYAGQTMVMGWYHATAIKLDYLLGRLLGPRISDAEVVARVEAVELGISGQIQVLEVRYYAMLGLLDTPGAAARPSIAAWREHLARCADRCPANFRHQHLLVEAELMRASQGALEPTIELYEQAIDAAREHGVLDQEALACWRFGEFWRARGSKRTARAYLDTARELYERWGAARLVRELERRYPELLDDRRSR